jgi:hypothetical protein
MDRPIHANRPRPRREAPTDASQIAAALDAAAAHYEAGRLEAAAEIYRKVETRDPDDIRAIYSLAVIDLRRRRWVDARRRLKAVARRQGSHFAAMHNLGVAEQNLGAWEAAAEAYDRALALRPDARDTAFALAVTLGVTGRVETAIDRYRALAADPAVRLRALVRLAVLRASAVNEEELATLRQAREDASLDAQTRVGLLFALAEALEARGVVEEAWSAYVAGNALKRDLLTRGDPDHRPDLVARDHEASIERVRTLFTTEFLAANAGRGDQSAQPIFVLGMPRCGSSLVEQILASHPHVQGLGESGALWSVLEDRFPYPPAARREPDHFRVLARRYLDAQRSRGWAGRTRLVDKTLDNHLQVGMIHLMFPRATILHVTRDPLDIGVACWRQLFATGNETLYDLADIGAEQRRYHAMMDHWARVLPGRVIEVNYERLVADPEGQIRALVTDVCAMPWSQACLRFHETNRPVATASTEQVRRPIFASSVGRWRRYADHIHPLIAALGDLAPGA